MTYCARVRAATRWILPLAFALSGCAIQPSGGDGGTPGDGQQGGSLSPAQLDGTWKFVPDSDAIPSECYEFDAGTLIFYSNFCDDVTDLEEPVAAQISGSTFSLTFQASLLSAAGAMVQLEGTVIDENTIRVEMTLTGIGSTDSFMVPGRLVRDM